MDLKHPPIEEVICGLEFEPIPGLSPVLLGAHWEESFRTRYDQFRVDLDFEPAAVDLRPLGSAISVAPVAGVFESSAEDVELSVLSFRLRLRWKRDRHAYPRCRDYDGKRGMISRLIHERDVLEEVLVRSGLPPVQLRAIWMVKHDLLVQGTHWDDLEELAVLVPMARPAIDGVIGGASEMRFDMSREEGGGRQDLRIWMPAPSDEDRYLTITTATRALFSSDAEVDLRQVFERTNTELNERFRRVLNLDAYRVRAAAWG